MDELAPETTGAQLRAGREAAALSLTDVASATRIPERHLLALEEGRLTALPGRTYVIGFARSYARAVGLDEEAIVRLVRADLGDIAPVAEQPSTSTFAPGDPARVPSARFAWIAAGVATLLAGTGLVLWHFTDSPQVALPSLMPEPTPSYTPVAKQTPAPVPTNGPVVFTAQAAGVWVKLYDAAGKELFQKQLAQGESFTVPADANGPQLWTGSPEALAITIGGQAVAKLADSHKTVKDMPVSAAALLARVAPVAAPSPGAAASPGAAGAMAPATIPNALAPAPAAVSAIGPAAPVAARPVVRAPQRPYRPRIKAKPVDASQARLGGILPPPVEAAKPAEAPTAGGTTTTP